MSKPTSPTPHDGSNDRLRSFVNRITRLEDEKKGIADDIRDIYAEAKSVGYNVKAIRHIIREQKQDASERQIQETMIELYKRELGLIADLPLGQAAIARAS